MYGEQFKQQLDIYRIYQKNKKKDFLKELLCEIARRKPLTKKILKLPEDIQKHIYIYAIKDFYRKEYVPEMGKIPMYYQYHKYLTKEKQKTFFDNIHFLHLECNTLPENKSWIMGCQCEFCLNEEQKEDKNKHYLKYIEDDIYFLENVKCSVESEINHWNMRWIFFGYDFFADKYDSYIRVFDPLYNRYIDPTENTHIVKYGLKEFPLSFSEEL